MVEFEISNDFTTAARLAEEALKARLYVNGWCLGSSLIRVRDTVSEPCWGRHIVALGRVDTIPVSVILAESYHRTSCINPELRFTVDLQAFTRKSYRRMGIASKGVAAIKEHIELDGQQISMNLKSTRLCAGYGIKGSSAFWNSVNIDCN